MMNLLRNLDRRLIFLIMGLAVAIPVLLRFEPPSDVSMMTRNVFNAVEELPDGSRVLLSFDFDPGSQGELLPMAMSFTRHLAEKKHKIYFMCLWPLGEPFIEDAMKLLQEEYPHLKYGTDYMSFGYKPGGEAVIKNSIVDWKTLFITDSRKQDLNEISLTANIKSAKDLHRSLLRDTFYGVRDLEGAIEPKLQLASKVVTYFSEQRELGEVDRNDLETLADAYMEIAEIRGGTARGNIGELEQAVQDIRAARAVWEDVASVDPTDTEPKFKVALMYRRESLMHQKLDHLTEAVAALEAAGQLLETIKDDDPKSFAATRVRGLSLLDQGDIRYNMDDLPLAKRAWTRGLKMLSALAERFPDNQRVQADHAHALRRVGLVVADDDPRHAIEHFRQSRDIFQARHDAQPQSTIAHRDLGWSHYFVGWSAMLIPLPDESVQAIDSGWRIIVLRCSLNPNDVVARSDVEKYLGSLIEVHADLDVMNLVPDRTRHAALVLQPIVEANPRNVALAEVLRQVIDAGQQATAGALAN